MTTSTATVVSSKVTGQRIVRVEQTVLVRESRTTPSGDARTPAKIEHDDVEHTIGQDFAYALELDEAEAKRRALDDFAIAKGPELERLAKINR